MNSCILEERGVCLESNINIIQRVIIASIYTDHDQYIEESLNELGELVKVAGGEVVGIFTQKLPQLRSSTLMGSGKLNEIKEFVEKEEIDLLVTDQELSGVQMKNIEEVLACSVLDRTGLILDIFALRAKSNEGKLQVLLGQLNYRKNHLIGMKNLSRLAGGIGTRGPGEQKLELDRRHIRTEIQRVKKRLETVKKQRSTNRNKRRQHGAPVISFVGYTNAGKSSLMNRILVEGSSHGKEVFVKDMPFASLDPDTRLVKYKDGQEVFLSDTVGFISNLPTALIEAFHATLEEVKEADILVHVLDGSREDVELQYETTMKVLRDLNVLDRPIILLINKMDKMDKKRLALSTYGEVVIYASVKEDKDFSPFYKALNDAISSNFVEVDFIFPYMEQELIAKIQRKYADIKIDYKDEGIYLSTRVAKEDRMRYKKYLRKKDV